MIDKEFPVGEAKPFITEKGIRYDRLFSTAKAGLAWHMRIENEDANARQRAFVEHPATQAKLRSGQYAVDTTCND